MFYLFDADVAVQLPDKKSIIMYLTSLFEVLPKQVTMEDIREVETLPRRYKQECEDGDFSVQQVCLSSKPAFLFWRCNFSWSSWLSVSLDYAFCPGQHNWENTKNHSNFFVINFSLSAFLFLFWNMYKNLVYWDIKFHLYYAAFCFVFFASLFHTSWSSKEGGPQSLTEFSMEFVMVSGSDEVLVGFEIHCWQSKSKVVFSIQVLY